MCYTGPDNPDETVTHPAVTRFEVIDHAPGKVTYSPDIPRSVVAYGVNVELSWQDDGTTMKVFLTRKEP